MKSFMNFRTAILCCAYCLCACSMSVNAQEITVNLETFGSTTGSALNTPFNESRDRFAAELSDDGLSNSNELIEPITTDVVEAGNTGLQLTIVNATSTTGIDGFEGDNRANFNFSGLGLGLTGPALRSDPNVDANSPAAGAAVESSGFRLDSTHDEFVTFSFNQAVTVSAIVLTNFDDRDTFQFGPAENITNLNDLTLPDLTMGTVTAEGKPIGTGTLITFTFETPLEIAAGEEILIGQTGFDPDLLTPANVGVGFERIILTIDDDAMGPGMPIKGDVNTDGTVNFFDIQPFIDALADQTGQAEADIDCNGVVNFFDIQPFIDILAAGE